MRREITRGKFFRRVSCQNKSLPNGRDLFFLISFGFNTTRDIKCRQKQVINTNKNVIYTILFTTLLQLVYFKSSKILKEICDTKKLLKMIHLFFLYPAFIIFVSLVFFFVFLSHSCFFQHKSFNSLPHFSDFSPLFLISFPTPSNNLPLILTL
jgi:hypothetical protein